MKPIDVGAIILRALEAIRPAAEAKSIRLDYTPAPVSCVVTADADRLQQIMWNLLANSIKFTPEGGTVKLLVERTDTHARILVRDNGRGISPEFLPHVFDRFRQADSSMTRAHSGLGLGLAIVRHLVELHGGVVQANSRGEGYGATFTVTLPLRAVHALSDARTSDLTATSVPEPTSETTTIGGVRVLLVDDQTEEREYLASILADHGAEVTAVSSARKALEILERTSADVLVSDIGMPGENGYDLIRQVRARELEFGNQLPAVALTPYPRSEERLLAAGFQMHIKKPVKPASLVAAVANCAGRVSRAVSAKESRSGTE